MKNDRDLTVDNVHLYLKTVILKEGVCACVCGQLMCCSVEDLSWDVYQKSQWYEGQPGIPRTGPFVPGSMCFNLNVNFC